MKKLTFYIGLHNKDSKFKKKVIFKDLEFKNEEEAARLLHALEASFHYLIKTKGDLKDDGI